MNDPQLRPASDDDFDFLYRLHRDTLKAYIDATWGWDEAFHRQSFTGKFEPGRWQIVVVDGRDVGGLALETRDAELFLSGIYILPDHQNRGLGTTLLRGVLAQARRSGRPVTLQVMKVNPARRLYERLGFAIVGETETHYRMKAEPA